MTTMPAPNLKNEGSRIILAYTPTMLARAKAEQVAWLQRGLKVELVNIEADTAIKPTDEVYVLVDLASLSQVTARLDTMKSLGAGICLLNVGNSAIQSAQVANLEVLNGFKVGDPRTADVWRRSNGIAHVVRAREVQPYGLRFKDPVESAREQRPKYVILKGTVGGTTERAELPVAPPRVPIGDRFPVPHIERSAEAALSAGRLGYWVLGPLAFAATAYAIWRIGVKLPKWMSSLPDAPVGAGWALLPFMSLARTTTNAAYISVDRPEFVRPENEFPIEISLLPVPRVVENNRLRQRDPEIDPFPIKKRDRVHIQIECNAGVSVRPDDIAAARRPVRWNRETKSWTFWLRAPQDYAGSDLRRNIDVVVQLFANGYPLGRKVVVAHIPCEPNARITQKMHREYAGCDRQFTRFVSYAREDFERVDIALRKLRVPAATTFIDVRAIPSGTEWQPALSEAIQTVDEVLLFWSRVSANKAWVQDEYQYTLRRQRERGLPKLEVYWFSDRNGNKAEYTPLPDDLSSLHATKLDGDSGGLYPDSGA